MKARLSLVFILLLLGAPVHAQDSRAEITFWESVRDSKDPAELRAYIDRYPNGAFVVLARRRLAALESAGPAPAAPQSAPAAASPALEIAWTLPQPGDSWTYRLATIRRVGELRREPEHRHEISVASIANGEVVDRLTIDGGGTPLQTTHARGAQLIAQGAAVFSPYLPLVVGGGAPTVGSVGRVRIVDPACVGGRHICDAKGRTIGKETVRVPAGTFAATKIIIEQSWRSTGATAGGGSGGRTLIVWYAPEVKRAVKYASRTSFGAIPPIDPDFDLELVSFKVN